MKILIKLVKIKNNLKIQLIFISIKWIKGLKKIVNKQKNFLILNKKNKINIIKNLKIQSISILIRKRIK